MFGPLIFGPVLLAVCVYAWLRGGSDARIVAGSGDGSLAHLRVGDEVVVTYELGEERHHVLEIRVTRAAPPKGVE